MNISVELIYDLNCPNVQGARRVLLQAFADLNITPKWTEWDRKSPESPPYTRFYGSPTILVNGQDVAGTRPVEEADCCRVYAHGPGGLRRVPAGSSIVAALRYGTQLVPEIPIKKHAAWWRSLPSLPSVGAAFLPVGGCPACWPVYSAVLASLGLTFLLDSAYILWVTLTLLGVALVALAFRAKARRGFGPLLLGAASVGLILLFKFAWISAPLVYVGLSGLVIASFWNSWPKKTVGPSTCPRCAPIVGGSPAKQIIQGG